MITLYSTKQPKNGISISIQAQEKINYCQIKFFDNWNINNLISSVKISITLLKNLKKEQHVPNNDEQLSLLFLDFSEIEFTNTKKKNSTKQVELKDKLEYYIEASEKMPIVPLTSLVVTCKSRYFFTKEVEDIINARYEWDNLEITNNRKEALEFIAMG